MTDGAGSAGGRGRVLLTDHPWPGVEIEERILDEAGYDLIDGSPGDDPDELVRLGADVVGILTCWAPVPRPLIDASPRLRVVSRLGVGIDNIDVDAAVARGAAVTRVPDYCVEEVSDHVVGLVLAWARGLHVLDRSVRAGRWNTEAPPLRRVRDLVVGVWGTGNNGLATARKFAALGCTVLVDNRHPERATAGGATAGGATAGGATVVGTTAGGATAGGATVVGTVPVEAVPVAELLARADVVSVHVPLSEATRGLVGAEALGRMRPGSLLVNTARGGLVDVDALAAALDRGRPGAAALDVLPDEPQVPAVLAGRDDVLITPHVAFSSIQSVRELRTRATEDLVRVLRGQPARDLYRAPAG